MSGIAIQSFDLVIRGFYIKNELTSTRPKDAKIRSIAYHLTIMAVDSTLLVVDPYGISTLGSKGTVTCSQYIAFIARKASSLFHVTENMYEQVIRMHQAPATKVNKAAFILHALAAASLLGGEAAHTTSEFQLARLNPALKELSDKSFVYYKCASNAIKQTQDFCLQYGNRICQKFGQIATEGVEKVKRLFQWFTGSTPTQTEDALDDVDKQALDATDALIKSPEGKSLLSQYLERNFYPLPDIYRNWYQTIYINIENLLCPISKKPPIIPCRIRADDGTIGTEIYDLLEIKKRVQSGEITIKGRSINVTHTKNVGSIRNNKIEEQGNNVLFIDRIIQNYIYCDLVQPLQKVVKEKLQLSSPLNSVTI